MWLSLLSVSRFWKQSSFFSPFFLYSPLHFSSFFFFPPSLLYLLCSPTTLAIWGRGFRDQSDSSSQRSIPTNPHFLARNSVSPLSSPHCSLRVSVSLRLVWTLPEVAVQYPNSNVFGHFPLRLPRSVFLSLVFLVSTLPVSTFCFFRGCCFPCFSLWMPFARAYCTTISTCVARRRSSHDECRWPAKKVKASWGEGEGESNKQPSLPFNLVLCCTASPL